MQQPANNPFDAVVDQYVGMDELLHLRHPYADIPLLPSLVQYWFLCAREQASADSARPIIIDVQSLAMGCFYAASSGQEVQSKQEEQSKYLALGFHVQRVLANFMAAYIAQRPPLAEHNVDNTGLVYQFDANVLVGPDVLTLLKHSLARLLQEGDIDPGLLLVSLLASVLADKQGQRALHQVCQLATIATAQWQTLAEELISSLSGVSWRDSDTAQSWQNVLQSIGFSRFPPPPEDEPFPNYSPDVAGGYINQQGQLAADDPLGSIADARAMARLICNRHAQPPLSIGLFAPWGGGKSTYMKFLRAAIEETTRLSRSSADKQDLLIDHAVHIEFNAWHYVDANLWASLATRIFAELQRQVDEGESQGWLQQSGLNQLSEQLATVKQARAAHQQQVQGVSKQLDSLRNELQQLDSQQTQASEQLASLSSQDVSQLVSIANPSAILTSLRTLGLNPDYAANAQQLLSLWQENQGLSRTVAALGQAAMARPLRNFVLIGVGLVLFVAVSSLIPMLLSHAAVQPVITTVATISGAISGGLAWLLPQLKQARNALAPLQQAVFDIQQQRQTLEAQRQQQLQAKQHELEQLTQQYQQASQQLSSLSLEQARLTAMDSGDDPVGLMTAFIDERAKSDKYTRHLGLVSLLREDFETMAKLLSASSDKQGHDERPLKIDRIVLYVDDLDRCRDEQVVAVLEAVHLLLAFPLFVVVVGVDVRWVTAALGRFYQDQFGPQGSATPVEYLSKIFQIPFWLPQLQYNDDSYQRLIATLLDEANTPAEQVKLSDETVTKDARSSVDDATSGPAMLTDSLTPVAINRAAQSKPTLALLQRTLSLDPRERILLDGLASLVGASPRGVKRFLNVYRMIKARQSSDFMDVWLGDKPSYSNPEEPYSVASKIGYEPAFFPAVMLALAIELSLADDFILFLRKLLLGKISYLLSEMRFEQLLQTLAEAPSHITPLALVDSKAKDAAALGEDEDREIYQWLCAYCVPSGQTQIPVTEGLRKGAATLVSQIRHLYSLQGDKDKTFTPYSDYPWIHQLRKVYLTDYVQRYTFRRI
jgi:cob(I)alamin adenosyltransferase